MVYAKTFWNPKLLEVLQILKKTEKVQASRLAKMVSFGETTFWSTIKQLRELELIEEVPGFNEKGKPIKFYKLSSKGQKVVQLVDEIQKVIVEEPS